MKKLFVLWAIVFGAYVSAAVKIDTTIHMGQEQIKKTFIYKDANDATAIIECDRHILEGTVLEANDDGVVIEIKVFDPAKADDEKLIAKPVIKAAWGQLARIACSSSNNADKNFAIELIATRE